MAGLRHKHRPQIPSPLDPRGPTASLALQLEAAGFSRALSPLRSVLTLYLHLHSSSPIPAGRTIRSGLLFSWTALSGASSPPGTLGAHRPSSRPPFSSTYLRAPLSFCIAAILHSRLRASFSIGPFFRASDRLGLLLQPALRGTEATGGCSPKKQAPDFLTNQPPQALTPSCQVSNLTVPRGQRATPLRSSALAPKESWDL